MLPELTSMMFQRLIWKLFFPQIFLGFILKQFEHMEEGQIR